MASRSMVVKVVCLGVVVCMVLGAPLAHGAITCDKVDDTLAPCVSYLRNPGAKVPPSCCAAVQALNKEAKTTPDRQAACRCFKPIIQSIPKLDLDLLAKLPGEMPMSDGSSCTRPKVSYGSSRIRCHCGEDAAFRTSSRVLTYGRRFFNCSKMQGQQYNAHFLNGSISSQHVTRVVKFDKRFSAYRPYLP
ncbi:lipid transfer protein [Senna tora]|uniref:Non-specific lipid-transfer protein n=1 Tax=Senna tora TaxID=362788 RepID=A0A835CM52_9FABA|nr:lipid transfer protein [Senna tora]